MTLAKTLLAGAAVCALVSSPALAAKMAPNIHLALSDSHAPMKMKAPAHFKTGGAHTDVTDITETFTLSYSLSFNAYHKVPVLLWAYTWYNASCVAPSRESVKLPRSTAAAKITHGTTSGTISACGSSPFNFYGPIYDLKHNTGSDSFVGSLVAKKYSGYNLTANIITDVGIY